MTRIQVTMLAIILLLVVLVGPNYGIHMQFISRAILIGVSVITFIIAAMLPRRTV